MNLKNTMITLLVVCVMLFACVQINTDTIMAAADFTFDTTNGYITGYNGSDKDVVIPNEIAGYTIRGIKAGCFQKTDITTIVIPDTITEIKENVFNGCSHLKEIHMSNNIVSIGEYAFAGCSTIKKVEIPYSVKEVANNAFRDCTSLKKSLFRIA